MDQTTTSPLLGLPLAYVKSIHSKLVLVYWAVQFNLIGGWSNVPFFILLGSTVGPTPAHQRPETLLTIRTNQQQSTIHINGYINQQHHHQTSGRRRGGELHNSSFSENSSTDDYWALCLHKTKTTTIIITFNILLDKNTQYVGGEYLLT